jgi:hypothetical protein
VAAGHVLVAAVDVRLTGGYARITAPSGWSLVRRDSSTTGASLTQAVYVKVAGSSEPASYTWSFPYKTASAGAILAYSGVDPSSPVLAHSGRFLASSTGMTAPSVNVSVSGSLVLGLFGSNGTRTITPPSGMTERFEAIANGTYDASSEGADYVPASTGATGDKTAQTGGLNSSSIGQLVVLRPGNGGGGGGGGSSSPPPPSAPVNTSPPVISGTPQVGHTLTASTGSWSPSTGLSYAYRWLRCNGSCSTVSGATSSTYVPVAGDVGWSLAVSVTASNSGGSGAATSSPTAPVAAAPSPPSGGGSGGSVGSALPAPLPPSTGTTFYVSTSGSDSNAGTKASPWRTIGKALRTLNPGQTALVRAGTYAEKVEWSRSGSASAPITLAAYPGEQPVITGRVKIWAYYVRLSGFEIVGQTSLNPSDVVLYVSGAQNLEVSHNEIRNGAKSGVYIDDGTTRNIQIVGNWIHDNGTHATHDHGLYWSDGTGGLIANNVIEDNLAYGIHLYPDGDDVIVTSNTIAGNGMSGIIVAGSGALASDRNLLVNNVLAFNADYGIRSYWSGTVGSGNAARTNLGWQNAKGNFATGSLATGLALSGSMTGDPLFAGRSSSNYRLQAGSAALDLALADHAPGVDYDGKARPVGPAADLGAFER